jgi:hypothetical protein
MLGIAGAFRSSLMNFTTIHEAVRFYHSNNMRCMPIYGPQHGCKHPLGLCGYEKCFGKIPKDSEWANKDFKESDFEEGDNLALIMGKQRDGRWLVGLDIDGELDLSQYWQLPFTLESTTRRGRHLIFEVYPNLPLGNWADIFSERKKKELYKGQLDIKYARGAMVSPPSKSSNLVEHKWLRWMKPAQLPSDVVRDIIRFQKKKHPLVKRYPLWSLDPSHKGKKP